MKSERERDTRFQFLNNVCRTFCSNNQSVVESLQHTATCWNKNKHQLAHQVDLATVMAEMFKIGDRNKDDVLTRLDFFTSQYTWWLTIVFSREEFVSGMLEHPVTSKILRIKKIDAILDTM